MLSTRHLAYGQEDSSLVLSGVLALARVGRGLFDGECKAGLQPRNKCRNCASRASGNSYMLGMAPAAIKKMGLRR